MTAKTLIATLFFLTNLAGADTGVAGPFGDSNWVSMGGFAAPEGEVRAAIFDQAGNLYIGGSFTSVAGGVPANLVAKWDGSEWTDLGFATGLPSSKNVVYALAIMGGDLYVGGAFGLQRWVSVKKRWESIEGGEGWVRYQDGATVRALEVVETPAGARLFVGGKFNRIGSNWGSNVAVWDGSAWSALGEGIPSGIGQLGIFSLRSFGGKLYAAGDTGIRSWDGGQWTRTEGASQGAALVATATGLYASGKFFSTGGASVTGVAKWSQTGWTLIGAASGGGIYSLLPKGEELVVGGSFEAIGGVSANRLARWDGAAWSAIGNGIKRASPDGIAEVYALAGFGERIVAGGNFPGVPDQKTWNLAQWDGQAWRAFANGFDAGGEIGALAVSGNEVYAGGWFTMGDCQNVAKWAKGRWSGLGGGLNGGVRALAVSGDRVFAGGNFTKADGLDAQNVAQWDGTAWTPLGAGVNGEVRALAVMGTDLYAAGRFTTAGGQPAAAIAKWNGQSWSPVAEGLPGGYVNALLVANGDLYAGGTFPSNVAKWNGTSWSLLSGYYDIAPRTRSVVVTRISGGSLSLGNGSNSYGGSITIINSNPGWLSVSLPPEVNALAFANGVLYAGGPPLLASGSVQGRFAGWTEATGWQAPGTLPNRVRAMATCGDDLYFGWARWNPDSGVRTIGSGLGLRGTTYAIAASGTTVWVGGTGLGPGERTPVQIGRIGGLEPEIGVWHGPVEIANGDDSPNREEGTQLPLTYSDTAYLGQSAASFEIKNSGGSPLIVRAKLTGPDAQLFSLPSMTGEFDPNKFVLGPGNSSSLWVAFGSGRPGPFPIGVYTATVVLESNDRDEPVYQFQVEAQVSPLRVTADGNTVRYSEDQSFGNVDLADGRVELTFVLTNAGNEPLAVGPVTVDDGEEFHLVSQPDPMIAAGGSTSFSIVYDPSSTLDRRCIVRVPAGDPSKPFEFFVTGSGTFRRHIFAGEPVDISLGAIPIATAANLQIDSVLPPGLRLVMGPEPRITGTISKTRGYFPAWIYLWVPGSGRPLVIQLTLTLEGLGSTSSFELLLKDGPPTNRLPAGKLTLAIQAPARGGTPLYSAVMERLGEPRRSARGEFRFAVTDPVTLDVEFPKTANLPPATYRVTFSYPYDQVTAVDRTDSEQAGQGFRVLPFIEKRVTPLFGWFSMTGLPSSIELSPGGLGYTIGTIAGNTQVRMSGYLGDGQPFAMSGRRSAWGQVIFWCRPYANPKSWIGGIADTDVSPPADPTVRNFAIPLSTEVRWYKEPDDRSRSYPDGFLNAPLPSGRPGVLSGDFYTWQGAPALKDWLAHQAESPLVLRLQGNSLPDWPIQRLPLKALGGSDEGTKAKGFEVPVRPNSSISGKDGVDANATLNTRNGRFNGILSHLGEVEKNYAFDGIVATDVFLSAKGFIKIPVKGKHGRTFVTAELETE